MCRSRPKCRDPTNLSEFKELNAAPRFGEWRRIQNAVVCRPFYELGLGTIAGQSSKLSANRNDKRREFLRGV
jgi:hypothetical protein